jgi:hypothetical protein
MDEEEIKINKQFLKVINDFHKDLKNSFPEYSEYLDPILNDIENDNHDSNAIKELYNYCKNIYPERFFDFLYQNEDIFKDEDCNTEFLPNIEFKNIWKQELSDNTRTVLWKYLQLICFSFINDDTSSKTFKDTANLFEAIDEKELKTKLTETMQQMNNIFGNDGSGINLFDFNDSSGNLDNSLNFPDPEQLHEHLNGILDGKLGRLASEITEETMNDIGGDISGANSIGDVFQSLFKNPGKLMNMIKKIGGNLDSKIKSGEIKESELIEEAGELMKKLHKMPGMKDMQKMMAQMGLPGGGKNTKFNMGALNQRMSNAKTKERLRKKLEKKSKTNEKDHQIEILEKQLAEARAENARQELLLKENNIVSSKPTKVKRKKKKKK